MFHHHFRKTVVLLAVSAALLALAISGVSAANSSVFMGNIASGAQYDLYTVHIDASTQVVATLVCDEIAPGNRPLDPVLSVYFPGSDSSNTINADVYNDDGFGSDDDPSGVDCNAFDSSRVIFTTTFSADYVFRADGFGSSTGPYTLTITTTSLAVAGAAFNPGDDRINVEAHAPVAIYCRSGGVEVWTISSSAIGAFLFGASAADVSASAPGSTFASSGSTLLSKLADGSLQVNATMLDGKGYVFIWNGCPMTSGNSYVVENGVAVHTNSFGS
jgi:hypothetical protein